MPSMSYRLVLAVSLLSLSLWGVLLAMNPVPVHEGQPDPAALKVFAQETNQFGFDLFQQLRTEPGNLFFSPYSISSALAMTATGARGETIQQMTKVLHIPDDVKRFSGLHHGLMTSLLDKPVGYDIRIANALWGQNRYPFKADFISLAQRDFRAEARNLDFAKDANASRLTINAWVEEQTNNRIKDLLPSGSITPLTRLVLTNAIYFKGTWLIPFDKKFTKPLDFSLTASEKVKTDMMYRVDDMRYTENDDLQALELPYKGNRLSMVVLLPKKRDGLSEVEAGLTSEKISQWIAALNSRKVILTFPKIKTTYSASLSKTLPLMGMVDAFNQGKADFSGMDGTRDLSISDVVHKAFCEINEEGTEAAAATGVIMPMRSVAPRKEPPPVEFQADHPYLYLIRDTQTGLLLFLGRVTDPRS
ncbi:MAG TPA: serpin family protein [Gemmatales bacterium]|nr:serpin family protein [Gemmatales bacterium]